MIIELQWVWLAEDREHEHPTYRVCGVCGFPAAASGGVVVRAATDDHNEMGGACEECIAYLGSRNPKRSPTLEEYRSLVAEHPKPMFASYEEMKAAAPEHEDPADTFYEASWLWRAETVVTEH